jgi:Uma2 family endonuclease
MKIAEFEDLAERSDSRLELLDGQVVGRADNSPLHALVVDCLRRRLDRVVPAGWFVREQKPLRLSDQDELAPDLAVVRGDPRDYATRHPGPGDVAIVVEASESSLERDQGRKRVIYGRARIPVYWVVNLVDRQVEVYVQPSLAGYRVETGFAFGRDVPVVIEGAQVARVAWGLCLHGASPGVA